MPREASVRNNWEKERRERFNKSFEELAKVLPSYDPSTNICRIEIIKKAISTISDLKQKLNKVAESTEELQNYKDDLVKKLQDRIKKLIIRNEELVKLFKDAGIKLPRVITTSKFRKRLLWSGKFFSQQKQKVLEKCQMEKENMSSSSSQVKIKRQRLSSTSKVMKKSNNSPIKASKTKKFSKKVATSNGLLLFSRLPTVPTLNQQFLLLPNPPLLTRTATVMPVSTKKPKVKKADISSTVTQINPTLSTLGSGTLILSNGNILSIVSQPQIVVPPFQLPHAVVNTNIPKTTSSLGINIDFKKNCLIKPKTCVTQTTQIIKVPIPAFTSKYANTSLLLKEQVSKGKKVKKSEKTQNKVKSGSKRKTEESINENAKKKCESCETKTGTNINTENISNIETQETIKDKQEENIPATPVSSGLVFAKNNENTVTTDDTIQMSAFQVATTTTDETSKSMLMEKIIPQKKSLNKTEELSNNLSNLNNISEKSFESGSKGHPTENIKAKKLEEATSSTLTTALSVPSTMSSIISSTSSTVSCSTSCLTVRSNSNDDTMKNIDLNLVHSDLSNDIFASLQVPPGCQNMESTSPTAAFLLAFPLVSSIKVTEVIDEDNSDSQRETPTLLQIGSMDTTKPSNNDALLNLDNFSFFNSKDICPNYYNSKLEITNNESSLTIDKHPEGRPSTPPNESPKSKNNDYIYTEENESVTNKAYEVFSKEESQSISTNNTSLNQSTKMFQEPENIQNSHTNEVQNNERFILYQQKTKQQNIFRHSESSKVEMANQPPTNELPHIIHKKIQNNCNILSNTANYSMTREHVCKKTTSQTNSCSLTDDISYKNYEDTHVNMGKTEQPSNQMFTKDIGSSQFNSNNPVTNSPKQFLNDEHNLNNYSSTPVKLSKATDQNLGKSLNPDKIKETYHYASKQFLRNDQRNMNNFTSNTTKINERTNQNLDKSMGENKIETYYNSKHFVQNDRHNLNNFSRNSIPATKVTTQNLEKPNVSKMREIYKYDTKGLVPNEQNLNIFPSISAKVSEGSVQNVEKTSEANKITEMYSYNPKHFLSVEHNNTNTFNPHSAKITDGIDQILEKSSQVNKMREMYTYNPKQLLSTEQTNTNTFNANSTKISEGICHNLKKNDATYYNSKQFMQNEQIMNTFPPNSAKMSEGTIQSLEKSSDITKTYHYNPFEVVQTSKEISLNGDSENKRVNNIDKDKTSDSNKRMDEICVKSLEEKSCYFSSNYSTYRPDPSKICPTCSYENTNRNYTNPFYTNCNYTPNYSDTNFNQNYYKSDGKPCYSLNYENYQEYRKNDPSSTRDRRNSTLKEKVVSQNKPVNWMTTEQKSQTSDCFLPSFTNQSYSFTSCISADTNDNNFGDTKKTDIADKRFTWSPTKLPNFLEPSHNFITPTLPTLVGDLALGNSLPLTDTKTDFKYLKDVKRKTYDNQANFLSVSQLVNHSKTDTPARTISRRLSSSKSKNNATTKNKRFDKTIDKNGKPANNYGDIFYDQKTRNSTKNVPSNYSAEALIGNQCPQEEKKNPQNSNKLCSSNFLTENIVNYLTSVEDTYLNQNQNFHTYTHNSFQNNSYSSNSFIYTAPSIASNYLTNNFESPPDYSAEGIINYCGLKDNKSCTSKSYRLINKEEKNAVYPNNVKKGKKINQSNNTSIGNFEYPLLPIQGTTGSPILPDDFQTHATFLPPTTPYACKNSLYQKQNSEYNTAPLLPLPGITRTNIQHPEVSPSLNPVGTSLTNFNLSTIFPEINKGTTPNAQSNSNKTKNNSSYLEVPFNNENKYGFAG